MMTPKSFNSHFKKKYPKSKKKQKEEISICHICPALCSSSNSFIGRPRHFCITGLTSSHNKHFVGIPETLFLQASRYLPKESEICRPVGVEE